ncbi:spindle and kinetochore-associated protein 2 isoform X1 [Ochotona princeps]|uniref:spindle and kinetochore-associated protein 2 isoform X1 n=1 Tax=Ochotona princeps TaxID=9978 RepID=UPI0027148044|nr:spindle and kinetochore-associated protein 2 isoform X1 [Ochotona princeps]
MVPKGPQGGEGRGRSHSQKGRWAFQKADSDLNYIQHRLEYEIKANHPESAGEKNPVTLLKEMSAMKSRYQALFARFKPLAAEQKETKNRICAAVNKTMIAIQQLQKQTDLELSALTEEEKAATEQFKSHMLDP